MREDPSLFIVFRFVFFSLPRQTRTALLSPFNFQGIGTRESYVKPEDWPYIEFFVQHIERGVGTFLGSVHDKCS